MGKRFYKLAGATVRLFSHRMKTEWETPFEEGPCVFVVNHAGNHGPVDMCAKFPLRDKLHPWVNSEMLSKATSGYCELHLVDGATHAHSRAVLGEEAYTKIVREFLGKLEDSEPAE